MIGAFMASDEFSFPVYLVIPRKHEKSKYVTSLSGIHASELEAYRAMRELQKQYPDIPLMVLKTWRNLA